MSSYTTLGKTWKFRSNTIINLIVSKHTKIYPHIPQQPLTFSFLLTFIASPPLRVSSLSTIHCRDSSVIVGPNGSDIVTISYSMSGFISSQTARTCDLRSSTGVISSHSFFSRKKIIKVRFECERNEHFRLKDWNWKQVEWILHQYSGFDISSALCSKNCKTITVSDRCSWVVIFITDWCFFEKLFTVICCKQATIGMSVIMNISKPIYNN